MKVYTDQLEANNAAMLFNIYHAGDSDPMVAWSVPVEGGFAVAFGYEDSVMAGRNNYSYL